MQKNEIFVCPNCLSTDCTLPWRCGSIQFVMYINHTCNFVLFRVGCTRRCARWTSFPHCSPAIMYWQSKGIRLLARTVERLSDVTVDCVVAYRNGEGAQLVLYLVVRGQDGELRVRQPDQPSYPVCSTCANKMQFLCVRVLCSRLISLAYTMLKRAFHLGSLTWFFFLIITLNIWACLDLNWIIFQKLSV
jgi:hypothetical protein